MDTNNNVSAEWHYEENGRRKGPVAADEIQTMIETGLLATGCMVWKQGLPDWTPIEKTEFNAHLLQRTVPPPLHGAMVNNTVVWILAFAPIIGYLLECFVAGAVHHNDMTVAASSVHNYWFITVGLNLALSYFDEKRLRDAGVDTSKFKGMVWLIPVYLFQRTKNLKQSLAYFISWLICFAVILFG